MKKLKTLLYSGAITQFVRPCGWRLTIHRHYQLARALQRIGRPSEARVHFAEAQRLSSAPAGAARQPMTRA